MVFHGKYCQLKTSKQVCRKRGPSRDDSLFSSDYGKQREPIWHFEGTVRDGQFNLVSAGLVKEEGFAVV